MNAEGSQERDEKEDVLGSVSLPSTLSKDSPIKQERGLRISLSPIVLVVDGSQSSSEHNATSPPTSLRASVEIMQTKSAMEQMQQDVASPGSLSFSSSLRNESHRIRARSMPLPGQPSRPLRIHRRSLSPNLKGKLHRGPSAEDERHIAGPSSVIISTPPVHVTQEDRNADDPTRPPSTINRVEAEELMRWARQPPSPVQRNLRTRKPAQLAPYTTEMQRYKRRLVRNDWQDAVVIEKEFLRAQREKRREREENGLSPVSGEEAEKRQRSNGTSKQRRVSTGENGQMQAREVRRGLSSRATPLQDRINNELFARYGGPPSSSSEGKEGQRESAALTRRETRSPSTSSQGARAPSRKRVHRALLSETESSSVEVHEISDDSSTQSEESDTEQSFIVFDDEENQDRVGAKERLSVKDMRYYKQQLKLARRTMPMAAAKRCIDDLMLMHRERKQGNRERGISEDAEEDTAVLQSPGILRPGESRTRINYQREEERSRLIDDADEESDDSNVPSPVTSDTETEGATGRGWMYDEDVPSQRWLHRVGRDRRDDIDRMLTSATRTRTDKTRNRAKGARKQGRQTRLVLEGKGGPSTRNHRERESNRDGMGGNSGRHRQSADTSTRKRKKKKSDINTTFSRVYSGPSVGKRLMGNPTIAQVRNKPRFSLLHDANLFEGMMAFASPASNGVDTPLSSSLATPSKSIPNHIQDWQFETDNRSPRPSSPLKVDRRDKEQPWEVSPGQRLAPIDLDRHAPVRHAAVVPTTIVQKRLELLPRTSTIAAASPAHLVKQRAQMDIWQDVSDLRLDFGLKPPPVGLSFHANTPLGKGRLFELLQLAKGIVEPIQPRPICVFGTNLTVDTFDGRELQDAFDVAKEELIPFLRAESQSDGNAKFSTSLSDLFRFVLLWLSATQDETKSRNVVRVSRSYVEEFLAIIKENKASKGPHHSTFLQSLRWFKIELGWREACYLICRGVSISQLDEEGTDWQAGFVQACQDLMLELLIHGLHRTMHSIKQASQVVFNVDDPAVYFTLDDAMLTDQSAQHWIGLVHLLTVEEAAELLGPFTSFWSIFEAATKQYQSALSHTKSGLVVAENGWYSIMAICSLGYFSASTGVSTSRTCLKGGCWPMVMQTISHVRLRADEQVEAAMPRAALQLRDSYIRLTLCRVLLLHTIWGWSYESCEATLGKLFALFDTHKLEDLPTESSHDFPAFLCLYDESRLLEDVRKEDTAFHIFIKILAMAATDLRGLDENQADRNVARLLSRFSPLRSMTFHKDLPPTTLQRSALFNHYSIALVYLHFVPTSHHQRLLQIQQYLSFSKADDKSQLVCIRAMMYAITVLQHHCIDIKEAIGWFKGAFKMLLSSLEELHRVGAMPGHHLKWQREMKTQKTLLIAALRSLQYVIKMETLDKQKITNGYPSVLLLDATWTSTLLQSQLAVQSATLTLEVFHLLQAFLARRLSAIAVEKKKTSLPKFGQVDQNAESQDSFADLFDDIDFDDALLLDAAGYEASNSVQVLSVAEKQEKLRELDREFALHLHSFISPAVFQLLSNLFHPANKPSFSMARIAPDQLSRQEPGYLSKFSSAIKEMSKTTLAETIIDTWAFCAWIMVEDTEVRQWSHYFNYGLEDPKRLQDEVAKRDVTLHFLLMISTKCLAQTNRLKTYESNLTNLWSCFMASFTSRNLTSQHLMCNNLRLLEWRREGKKGGLLRGMDWQDNPAWTVDDFERHRLNLLSVILTNFTASWQETHLAPKSLLFASLTSLLVSVRTYIIEDKNGKDANHLAFCNAVIQSCKDKLSDTLLRGVAAELKKTSTFLELQNA